MKCIFNKKNLVLVVAFGVLVWLFMNDNMPYSGSLTPGYGSTKEESKGAFEEQDDSETYGTGVAEQVSEPELCVVPLDEGKLAIVTKLSIQQADASSHLVSNSGNEYSVDNSFDGKLLTSWQDGESGYGEGSTLTYSWDENKTLRYICIYSGSGENKDKFYQNGRLKGITLSVDGAEYELELEDKPEFQMIEVSGELICDEITLVINSVYAGSIYEDTCLAEVEFFAD